MVYDCFIFNSELDLLNLRLSFLNDTVDYFVIVESERTLSGNSKPLYFQNNIHRFQQFQHKIIHLIAPQMPELGAWDYEYFQRNYIKEALLNCNDDDIIAVSDLDEIINLKYVLSLPNLQLPVLVDLPYYYYFLNLKAFGSFPVKPLIANYAFLKTMHIGERNDNYRAHIKNVLSRERYRTGWHFSYLFGLDIEQYQNKLQSFSHQEYNSPYYLNEGRITKIVKAGIDLYERSRFFYGFKNPEKDIKELMQCVRENEMEHFIYKPSLKKYYQEGMLGFVFKKKYIPFCIYLVFKFPVEQAIIKSRPFRKKLKEFRKKLFTKH